MLFYATAIGIGASLATISGTWLYQIWRIDREQKRDRREAIERRLRQVVTCDRFDIGSGVVVELPLPSSERRR